MRYRIGCVLVGLAIAVSTAVTAFAEADENGAIAQRALFVGIIDPVEDDVEVALTTTTLLVSGATLTDATVGVDGELVDVDDQGGFVGVARLDVGINELEIVASDADGNQVMTTLFVIRGDA